MSADYHSHLQECRAFLQKEGVDGFILSVNDEFFSEYPPEHFKRLEWLTGFTGSAGTAVILAQKAAFFTDGRYTLQATDELSASDYEIHNSSDLAPWAWLKQQQQPLQIAYDPWLFSAAQLPQWQAQCGKSTLVPLQQNPVDMLWTSDNGRPALSDESAFEYPVSYAGESRESKIARIAASIAEQQADFALITAPESLMWLLNIRGHDMHYTPLLLCRALVSAAGDIRLYAPPTKFSPSLKNMLGERVAIIAPEEMKADIAQLCAGKTILTDKSTLSIAFQQLLEAADATITFAPDPCTLPKALKNETELTHIAATHVTDGRALSKFLQWLPQQSDASELSAVDALEAFRKESSEYVEPSFPTISGFGSNGAIVHYRVTEKTDTPLQGDSLYLVDSGGQYLGGTTDVTRTLAIGSPSGEMKDRFTRVLKGHIALANAIFPKGTTGAQLDILARKSLWEAGLDYDHGTGHGVGCFLGVHEGPQGISKRANSTALQPGMILSNEPGYYKNGEYGIRIENLVYVAEFGKHSSGFSLYDHAVNEQARRPKREGFYYFRTLTCAPIDESLILWEMLTEKEARWMTEYHRWVDAQLSR